MPTVLRDKHNLGQSATQQAIDGYGKQLRMDLTLTTRAAATIGATVEGVVTDTLGAPIAGALVTLADVGLNPLFYVVTDANGKYLFNNIGNITGNTTFNIFAIANQKKLNQPASFPLAQAQNKVINFTLETDPSLLLGVIPGAITITGGTTPIAGAVITLYSLINGTPAIAAVTYSNTNGQFAFREVPPGTYSIKYGSFGYIGKTSNITIPNPGPTANMIVPGSTTLDPDPNPSTGTISGVIRDPNNLAIARADVILYDVTNNILTAKAFTKTNDNGVYLFINVPKGSYKIVSGALESYVTT